MKLIDQQIQKLKSLKIPQTKRPDFKRFWAETLGKAETLPLNVKGGRKNYPIETIEVRDVTYNGVDGTPIHAWVLLPRKRKETKIPVVVCYHGAGGSRGTPASHIQWLAMGAGVIAADFRMQAGETGSNTGFSGSGDLGWLSLGIGDKKTCYYYFAYTDAYRAIELARSVTEFDGSRIAVHGISQGGGMAISMAALHKSVSLCMSDVPSNSWFEKRLFDRTGGVANIAAFLRRNPESLAQVEETLSYFDNLNLAERIKCPTLVSVGLKDPTCPPDCVYASYNKIKARKKMFVYPFGEHGGGEMIHNDRKLEFLREEFFFGRKAGKAF